MSNSEINNKISVINQDISSLSTYDTNLGTVENCFIAIKDYLSSCSTCLKEGLKIEGKSADDGAIEEKVEQLLDKIQKIQLIRYYIPIMRNYMYSLISSLEAQLEGEISGN